MGTFVGLGDALKIGNEPLSILMMEQNSFAIPRF